MTHPIEFEGLVKKYGDHTVINELSFTVPEGSVVGLLGPNGAGKSTAMRVLLGLQKPTAGSARILGHAAGSSGFRGAVRKVGSIIESPPLYKGATALQNLEIRVGAYGMSSRDADVRGILNQVGLAERVNDRVGDFSLGMRQRMGIALALVGDPSIVVLDEPTNGLDPQGTVEIRDLVKSLPARGATTLLCTHRLAEVEATCDYVVVLRRGELLAQGPIDEVIAGATTAGYRIEVDPSEVPSALRVLGGIGLGELAAEGGVITTTEHTENPADITRALAAESIFVRDLHAERATLEQAFLKIVEEAGGV
ncbi:MAG: ABC transporter ATP-binding protein [Solirubrobacteraceae bacterium]|nr:ABC transporter ATP-binding protein [Solirubrobacteraceae bacterium]